MYVLYVPVLYEKHFILYNLHGAVLFMYGISATYLHTIFIVHTYAVHVHVLLVGNSLPY